jgi:hypothetical protein
MILYFLNHNRREKQNGRDWGGVSALTKKIRVSTLLPNKNLLLACFSLLLARSLINFLGSMAQQILYLILIVLSLQLVTCSVFDKVRGISHNCDSKVGLRKLIFIFFRYRVSNVNRLQYRCVKISHII